jgi:hypothetical protein
MLNALDLAIDWMATETSTSKHGYNYGTVISDACAEVGCSENEAKALVHEALGLKEASQGYGPDQKLNSLILLREKYAQS